jgi:hypothetical protein
MVPLVVLMLLLIAVIPLRLASAAPYVTATNHSSGVWDGLAPSCLVPSLLKSEIGQNKTKKTENGGY